jgi:hypothetical protein
MAVTVIKNYKRVVTAPKSKKGLIIGVSLLVATGIGIYVWYLHDKKKKELALKNGETPLDGATQPTSSDSTKSTNSSVEQSIKSSTNPIEVIKSAPKDVLKFQQWVNKNKGMSLKEDGYFTRKDGKPSETQLAWDKFGLEYEKVVNLKMQDLNAYLNAKGNPIGKVVYSKYAGADIFDGNVADNVFNKIAPVTKIMALGKVAKVTPTATGYWITFSGSQGKFYKTLSSNLNILA